MERVPDAPDSFARSADRVRVNDYDSFAEAYAAENENNLVNAYYERPAMLALAGDVAGRRILDAGCGSGALSAALRDRRRRHRHRRQRWDAGVGKAAAR